LERRRLTGAFLSAQVTVASRKGREGRKGIEARAANFAYEMAEQDLEPKTCF